MRNQLARLLIIALFLNATGGAYAARFTGSTAVSVSAIVWSGSHQSTTQQIGGQINLASLTIETSNDAIAFTLEWDSPLVAAGGSHSSTSNLAVGSRGRLRSVQSSALLGPDEQQVYSGQVATSDRWLLIDDLNAWGDSQYGDEGGSFSYDSTTAAEPPIQPPANFSTVSINVANYPDYVATAFPPIDIQVETVTSDGRSVSLWLQAQIGFNTIQVPYLLGDYNSDGVVDAADYTVGRDAMTPLLASLSGLDTWADHYGAVREAQSGTVPEPTTGLLLATFVAVTSAARRQ